MIIVGGMYRGCGSSFTTLALAEALRGRGVPHTVVEGGCSEPTFAARLQAGGRLPDKLVDWTQDREEEEAVIRTDCGEWLLLDPAIEQRTWQAERTFRHLSRLAAPITLVDISTGWSDPVASKLIAMADHIVCVTGPSYIQLSQPGVQERFKHVIEWRRSGRSVHLVLNRDTSFRGHQTFMQSLPVLPTMTLPNVQLEDMLTSEWSGRWLPDTHPVWRGMLAELNVFIDRLIPGISRTHSSTRRRWWTVRRHTR